MTAKTPEKKCDLRSRLVFSFGTTVSPPPINKELLGGKGAGLAEMAKIGLPVPPGFIISTEACKEYRHQDKILTDEIQKQIIEALKVLEDQISAKFGSPTNPLLVSVRSGAKISMPGMMDTVLNLGLNDASVKGFAEKSGNERLAYDNYRRFISMYGEIVAGIDKRKFDTTFNTLKMQEGADLDIDLSIEGLIEACRLFQKIYEKETSSPFPQDPLTQLFSAIKAVFNSWDSERCQLYRQIHHIPNSDGTAVTVQTMMFGNKNDQSATGVAFTRNPATGERHFYGEFLLNAQGEEVVAGIRTPHPINKLQKQFSGKNLNSLEEVMPAVYQQLKEVVNKLENHYKEMQDIEFTIDDGTLYMLQTRPGKRTGFAAVSIAVDMLKEGLIDEKTALKCIEPIQLQQLLAPVFKDESKKNAKEKCVAKGLNSGPGAACGAVALSSSKALEMQKMGIDSILVREESCPDDFPGMVAANGILTVRGGSTSHAAVVARGMGTPCVVGCEELHINHTAKSLTANGVTIYEGDPISIDGMTGEVYFCELETKESEIIEVLVNKNLKAEESEIFQKFQTIMQLADKYRQLNIRTNADTEKDSLTAKAFGAEGIGLCRTEHMFMDANRLKDVRVMFFSTSKQQRLQAVEKLLPHQKQDFLKIFRAMNGFPVTIRLLDPPLHEFLPQNDEELHTLANTMQLPLETLNQVKHSLEESNPMLGHRGCRLGIIYPEVTQMQTRAIIEAAIEASLEGVEVNPEIMVPLVSHENELKHQRALIMKTAEEIFLEKGTRIKFTIGTMIELPRAAITADQIATHADFFSFGTNDLTQTTYGISRDDSTKFIPDYIKGVKHPCFDFDQLQIINEDPFQVLDTKGVGELIKIAIEKGKATNKTLHLGVCGEHGGDFHSILFFQSVGLDYVSCSPYRIPIAKLSAARAFIEN